ncbi:MAG: 50S ribosomal protein L16 [Patescibacteria group bacterium]|nr:50S ribosomal protein L16 [Patescibacteria group bacterium]MDD5121048.1 50S ribosomal protein L16 [Patescibacteria group bacterium]MDD5221590.1 50S ribosomal protein L16 [Patescibacteria group bacterium]MDD5396033.1 50S ribosomal protein L16 [Patescibacteria group bacterium]
MLMPKKVKFRKVHKGRNRFGGKATRKIEIAFGEYGLKSLETKWITARQIEAARRAIVRLFKKGGKIWTRIFPDKSVTTKSAEVPMGGGKGAVDYYVAPIKAGTIMFEVSGVDEATAKEAMRLAGHKLSVKTRFVKKEK